MKDPKRRITIEGRSFTREQLGAAICLAEDVIATYGGIYNENEPLMYAAYHVFPGCRPKENEREGAKE